MSFLDRVTIAPGVYPFTPQTYDAAYSDRYRLAATTITPDRAEAIPAVYACTTVITEDIGKVPLHVFKDLGDTPEGRSLGKRRSPDNEWYDALHHQASEDQDAIGFREMMTGFALNRGRGVAKKLKTRVGGTVRRELVPLHPDLIQRERTDAGDVRWRYQNPVTNKVDVLLPDEVFVLWGRRRKSVIGFMREAFAMQLAMMELAGQTWQRGPRHTGAIQRPATAPKWDDKARENFRKAVDEYMGEGERAGRPMLLEDGMTWVNAGFSLHDSEFLGAIQVGKSDVCAAYRVPQHKIQELLRSTNNNIEQQSVDYVVDSVLGWAIRWEQAIGGSLLVRPEFAEHNLNGLLRGDSKTRAEVHAIYSSIGTITGNEIREDEGRNPLDGLDTVRVALNTANVPGTGVASAPPRYRALLRDQAARVVRKELQTLTKLAERTGGSGDEWATEVRAFYREHAEFTARILRIDDEQAAAYAAGRCQAVLAGRSSLEDPEDTTIGDLTVLALTEDRIPEGAAA